MSGLQMGDESVYVMQESTLVRDQGKMVTIPASAAGLNKAIQETSLKTNFFRGM